MPRSWRALGAIGLVATLGKGDGEGEVVRPGGELMTKAAEHLQPVTQRGGRPGGLRGAGLTEGPGDVRGDDFGGRLGGRVGGEEVGENDGRHRAMEGQELRQERRNTVLYCGAGVLPVARQDAGRGVWNR